MKKQMLIFLIIFLPISAMAQNDFHRWQIGASFSPDALGVGIDRIRDTGKFSFTTGLNTVYKFTNSFGIETGVFFSNKRFFYNTNRSGMPVWHYSFQYIDVPLRVNYYFGKGKLRGLATLGAVANFRQYCSIRAILHENSTEELFADFTKKIHFSTLVGIGMEYKLSDRFTLRAIPIARFGLKETIREYVIYEVHLWSLGAEIGIFYRLK